MALIPTTTMTTKESEYINNNNNNNDENKLMSIYWDVDVNVLPQYAM